MNIVLNRIGATLAAASVLALAAPAFASTPAFTTAAPGAGLSPNYFDQQVKVYNRAEIADLLRARSVQVVKFDTAWSDGSDATKAFDAMSDSDQSIHLLREGLKANPAAQRLLAEHHIAIDSVVDIAPGANGTVQIYVS